jgi:hypothetical protein
LKEKNPEKYKIEMKKRKEYAAQEREKKKNEKQFRELREKGAFTPGTEEYKKAVSMHAGRGGTEAEYAAMCTICAELPAYAAALKASRLAAKIEEKVRRDKATEIKRKESIAKVIKYYKEGYYTPGMANYDEGLRRWEEEWGGIAYLYKARAKNATRWMGKAGLVEGAWPSEKYVSELLNCLEFG